MLTEIQVTNERRPDLVTLALPLRGETRFPVAFADGLGPVKAELSSSEYANLDEDHFQSSRVGARNIVLTLELNPSYSLGQDPQSLRAELYQYFAPKSRVGLEFFTTAGNRLISGVVESVETPLFVQTPAVQISIMCYDPYFKSTSIRNVTGEVAMGSFFTVLNNGDVPTGFTLSIAMPNVTSSEFILSIEDALDERPMQIQYAFSGAKTLYISTKNREKDARISSAPQRSLLPHLVAGSGWPQLQPGENLIKARYASGAGNTYPVIQFQERFVGL